jgi:hypothetical protein
LRERRYEFGVERAIYLTVLHRLFASGSDRAAERWREPLAEEPSVLGSPRCVKDRIEEALFERRRDLFTAVDLVSLGALGWRGGSKITCRVQWGRWPTWWRNIWPASWRTGSGA